MWGTPACTLRTEVTDLNATSVLQVRYLKGCNRAKPKKRGRPATGRDPMYGARLSNELVGQIDAWAKVEKLSLSEAMRRLDVLADTVILPERLLSLITHPQSLM